MSIKKLMGDVVANSDILKYLDEDDQTSPPQQHHRHNQGLVFESVDDDGDDIARGSGLNRAGSGVCITIDDHDEMPQRDRQPERPDTDATWHLHGAINVPGVKHLFSNLSGDILNRWKEFKAFQEALTAVNTMHYQTFYRDRLQEVIGEPLKNLFKFYEGGNLILWRWSSLVQVCEALHRREGALRTKWSLSKFLNGENGESTKSFKVADSAIRSPFFWSYLKMVILLHGLINDLSAWAEGCAIVVRFVISIAYNLNLG